MTTDDVLGSGTPDDPWLWADGKIVAAGVETGHASPVGEIGDRIGTGSRPPSRGATQIDLRPPGPG